jgi:hypothetical protein
MEPIEPINPSPGALAPVDAYNMKVRAPDRTGRQGARDGQTQERHRGAPERQGADAREEPGEPDADRERERSRGDGTQGEHPRVDLQA